jgi:hypothetical protein
MGNTPRKVLWGLVCSLVAACLVATVFGCAHQPSIWVLGVDGANSGGFIYNVGNSRIAQSGSVDEFRLRSSKSAFFDGLRESYRVFAESDDRIQLIHNGQIYTVRQYADGHYALYGELFWVSDSDGAVWKFPFPTDKIDKIAGGDAGSPQPYVPGTEFTATCDLPYLLRFYEVYGEAVKVEGNRVSYGGLSIVVGDGGVIEVDVF